MDTNLFYREVFEDILGLDVLGLESQFNQLVKLIETRTLTTFGLYVPARYLMYLDLTDEANIIRKDHFSYGVEYWLRDPVLEKYHLPIIDIESIEYNNVGDVDPYDPQSAAYYSSVIASRNNLTLENLLMGSEYTYNRTLTDFALPYKRYHELRGSNVLFLKNFAFEGEVEIKILTRYPNIASIPEEYRQTVIDLAVFDVKTKLWNELKYLTSVVTPSGNMELRIDDWESAEKDRADYLRELKNITLPDRVGPSYFRIV